MPDFDILAPNAGQTSGIFMALDPAYQAKQQQVQQNAIGLNQAQLFKGGLPTDTNGNTDYGAAYNMAMQAGAYDLANNLVSAGIRMSSLNDHSTLDNPLGGGSQGGGRAGGQGGGAVPAAGGGMIAPSAGGDDYGRMPSASAGVGQASTPNSRGGDPTKGANPDVVNYIRQAFTARGINPNVALGVSASEGLHGFDPNGNSNPGDGNSSFGPFQLHMGGIAPGGNSVAGLGDDFAKATGLDPRDPSTWKAQVNFVADHVAQNGWAAFHGAKAAGISNWAGIGEPGTAGRSPLPASMMGMGAAAGQPPASGQASAPASAPSGGQAQPVSFGGPGAASSPASGAASSVAAARARLAAQGDADLDSLTPAQEGSATIVSSATLT